MQGDLVIPEKFNDLKKKFKIVLLFIPIFFSLHTFASDRDSTIIKKKFQYFFLESLRQKNLGNYAEAADNLYRCYELDKNNSVLYSELAVLNANLNIGKSAIYNMERALALSPKNVHYRQTLAQYYYNTSQYSKAADLYKGLVNDDKNKKNVYHYLLASIYTTTDQKEEAIREWDNLEDEVGINDKISVEKFKLYRALNKNKKAFGEIDRLIKAYSKETSYRALKGDLYMAIGDTEKGEKTYASAFKSFPKDPTLTYRYAFFKIECGEKEVGYDLLKELVKNNEISYDIRKEALFSLANDSASKIDDDLFKLMIKEYPNEEETHLVYASYLLLKNDSSAFNYIEEALAINPQIENSWVALASYHAEKKDPNLLYNTCINGLEQFPENSDMLYLLGFSLLRKKDSLAAIETWNKLASLAIESDEMMLASSVMGQIGDTYCNMGKNELAFAAYDSALVYNENNLIVLNNYAYYLSLGNKDLNRAEKMSGKTIKANPQSSTFLDTYAWISFKLGEYNIARLYIEQAYYYGGDKSYESTDHYGDILYKTGEPKEEYHAKWIKAWEMVQEKHPDELHKYEKLKRKAETGIYEE